MWNAVLQVQKLTDAHGKQVAQLRQEMVQAQSDMVGGVFGTRMLFFGSSSLDLSVLFPLCQGSLAWGAVLLSMLLHRLLAGERPMMLLACCLLF